MTTADTARLRALLAEARMRALRVTSDGRHVVDHRSDPDGERPVMAIYVEDKANAAMIAAAVNALPGILDALEATQAELEVARLATGLVRLCVNCGKTRPADYGTSAPRAGCPSPDACTWDMTPQEAADHWRKIAHDRYTALAAEREKVAKLVEAGEKALCHLTGYGEASTARIELRAAITEAGQ